MKKSFLLVALVVVFVLAAVSTSFAAWGDSTYINWTSGMSSPHRGYTTSTRNCAVCHSVHRARSNGELLLKSTVAQACNYCHINAAQSITQVYASSEANYTTDNVYNHSSAVTGGCSGCHTVHSAAAVGANDINILRLQDNPASTYGTYYTDRAVIAASTGDPTQGSLLLTQWCSSCHPYYNTNFNGTSHVMTAAIATYGNTAADNSVETTKVAWTKSEYCDDCHNAGANLVVKSNFPHYTSTAARFLTDGSASGSQVNNDGPCLRCHEAGAFGVSQSF